MRSDELIANIVQANVDSLAFTTNALIANLEERIRDQAKTIVDMYEYITKCEEEGRAPRERHLYRFAVAYDIALREEEER